MKQQCECLKKAKIDERNASTMMELVELQKKLVTFRKHKDELIEHLAKLREPRDRIQGISLTKFIRLVYIYNYSADPNAGSGFPTEDITIQHSYVDINNI